MYWSPLHRSRPVVSAAEVEAWLGVAGPLTFTVGVWPAGSCRAQLVLLSFTGTVLPATTFDLLGIGAARAEPNAGATAQGGTVVVTGAAVVLVVLVGAGAQSRGVPTTATVPVMAPLSWADVPRM